MDNNTEKAIKQYNKHLEHMRAYRKKNAEKLKDYMRCYYIKQKEENPEAYLKMLADKKAKYLMKKEIKNL